MPPKRPRHATVIEPAQRRPQPVRQIQQPLTPSVTKVHPLVHPAILARIGDFLDKGSLLKCIRVSRTWNQSFIPKVWHTTTLAISFYNVRIPATTFAKHATHIRKLALPVEDAVMFPTGQDIICPNLEELDIDRSNTCIPDAENLRDRLDFSRIENSMVRLIRNHVDSLKSLTFSGYLSPPLLDAIIACKKLEKLDAVGMFADRYAIASLVKPKTVAGRKSWVAQFGEFLSRLRSLTLSRTWYEDLQEEPEVYKKLIDLLKNIGPTRVRELNLDTGEVPEEAHATLPLFLIRKSPELKRLKWTIEDEAGHKKAPMTILAKADTLELPPGALQELECLELPEAHFDDADFQQVIQSIGSLSILDLSGTNFNESHWRVFQGDVARHLESLTQVNVQECIQLKGETVQEILCSMPNLEIFKADYIKDVNLLEDDRPWICRRMRELTLAFVGTRWGTESAFLSRVGTLTQLEVLRLPMSFTQRGRTMFGFTRPLSRMYNSQDVKYSEFRQHALMLTQEHGLNQLQHLRRLQRLEGTFNRRAVWRTEEIQFALKNWPCLRFLEGMVLDIQVARVLKPQVDISKCETVAVVSVGAQLFENW